MIVIVSEYGALGCGIELALGSVSGVQVACTVPCVATIQPPSPFDLLLVQGDDWEFVLGEVAEAGERFSDVECVVLLRDAAPDQLRELEERGASLVISDDINLLELTAVITSRGASAAAQPHSAPRLVRRSSHYTELTTREIEVAATIAIGLSNREIAARLNVRSSTVKNHLHNILNKLGLSSRAELARYTRHYKWVLPETSRTLPAGATPSVPDARKLS